MGWEGDILGKMGMGRLEVSQMRVRRMRKVARKEVDG